MVEKLENVIKDVFVSLGYSGENAKLSISSRPELCDYQINSVFKIAKENKSNPIMIGEKIVEEIKKIKNFSDYFKNVEFVKPGFINITVSDKVINDSLKELMSKKDLGIKKVENKTCIVDYGGPNIAKPLHVGHLRAAIIGESIKRIMKAKGYNAIGDIHLGDYGLQIGQVIYGLKQENLKPEDITLEILDRIYPKISKICKEDNNIKEICQNITKELQDGNAEYKAYWEVIYEVSSEDIKSIYQLMDVNFELWYGESDSYPYMDDLVGYLNDKGVVEIDDGAKIVVVKEETDTKELPPLILQKSNGAYLYATTDLATIYQRIKDFNPSDILYVVDDRQRLHFEQVFRVCNKSGLTSGVNLEHNYFGTVNGVDGKPLKTRDGGVFKLRDLLSEIKEGFINKKEENKEKTEEDLNIIVNAILKFADLQNNREKDYIFDLNKFADINGKTGPYILYTALRIKKLYNSYEIKNNMISDKIYNETDKELRMKLLEARNAFEKAVEYKMPHYIAEYLYELSVITNSFYQNNNFSNLKEEENLADWCNLLKYTYSVIEFLLDLLAIKIPSEM